jgi:hypothetical protein
MNTVHTKCVLILSNKINRLASIADFGSDRASIDLSQNLNASVKVKPVRIDVAVSIGANARFPVPRILAKSATISAGSMYSTEPSRLRFPASREKNTSRGK